MSLREEAFIVKLLPAFSGGKRSELAHATRLHFCDMGIRNAALNAFGADLAARPDQGALAERWVVGELAKSMGFGWSITYWNAKPAARWTSCSRAATGSWRSRSSCVCLV